MANTANRSKPQNAPSRLLSQTENDQIFNLLGKRCLSLATAVVQVFLAQPPNTWTKKCCGVACFVKDNNSRSYYIRVYDIMKGMKVWEQELYNQFKYTVISNKSFFHTFQTDVCWAGLNFASDAEANEFSNSISTKIRAKQQRKEEKKRRAPGAPDSTVRSRPNAAPPVPAPTQRRRSSALPPSLSDTRLHKTGGSPANRPHQRRFSSSDSPSPHGYNTPQAPSPTIDTSTTKKKDKKKDKGKKGRLTKADIGTPSDFTHVSHVGWDPEKGFDVEEMNPEVKDWFRNIGVSEDQLKDQNTANFIKDFVEEHGGFAAIKDDMARKQNQGMDFPPPPPPPSRGSAPPPPPPSNRSLPPPPPSRGHAPPPPPPSSRGAPPPPPSRALPPTPPSMAPPMPPPAMHARPMASPAPPPPPPIGGGPPPPPPPPPPSVSAAPPAPPITGGRGGLLNDIHKGVALKRVDPDERPAPVSSGRGALLDQIREGKALKKIDLSEHERDFVPSVPTDGLGAALLTALQQRSNAIHSEDSDDDDEDDDDFDDDEDWAD